MFQLILILCFSASPFFKVPMKHLLFALRAAGDVQKILKIKYAPVSPKSVNEVVNVASFFGLYVRPDRQTEDTMPPDMVVTRQRHKNTKTSFLSSW